MKQANTTIGGKKPLLLSRPIEVKTFSTQNPARARERRIFRHPSNYGWWLAAFAGALLFSAAASGQSIYEDYTFTTFAGPAEPGAGYDGMGTDVRFGNPAGVAADSLGNFYAADFASHTIRKTTPGGMTTTVAGLAGFPGAKDGTGDAARFFNPFGVAVDAEGNIYVADSGNHAIRKITALGTVTTLAGSAGTSGTANGTGAAARFNYPSGLTTDSVGNVYVADTRNHVIRKITSSGIVTTLAGTAGAAGSANGTGGASRFRFPSGLARDGAGNLYVADASNHAVRKISPAGVVTTWAGTIGSAGSVDGAGSEARFNDPLGIATGSGGNLYVADTYNHTIRQITAAGVVTTVAGSPGNSGDANGTGAAAKFFFPSGVAADSNGNVFVADFGNNVIRKIIPSGEVTTGAGVPASLGSADGIGTRVRFNYPGGLTSDNNRNIYVADFQNHIVRKITPEGVTTTLAGLAGNSGSADGIGTNARFNGALGTTADTAGNIFVADTGNHTIRKINPAGEVTTVAGAAGNSGAADGVAGAARFYSPFGVAADRAGNLYIGDTWNHTIRKISPAGEVTTFAGTAGSIGSSDGTGTAARFNFPEGLALDGADNLYVADTGNHTIRRISALGVVTTLAGAAGSSGSIDGAGASARFAYPFAVSLDSGGNVLVADTGNDAVRRITPDGRVTTLAGLSGTAGSADGTGRDARFRSPEGIAVDSEGNVYVGDSGNHSIRKGYPALPDKPVVDLATGGVGTPRHFNIANLTVNSLAWRFTRYPSIASAQISSADSATPAFTPDSAGLFLIRFQGTNGQGRVAMGTLSVRSDATPPTIQITSPTMNQRLTNVSINIAGSANDDVEIGAVRYQLNESNWEQASGGATWNATVTLTPGTNILRVYAVDTSGNISTTDSVSFVYVANAQMTARVEGRGTITPNYNGQSLEIGKSYSMLAKAATGYAFRRWMDGQDQTISSSPAITFVMASNLTLVAQFVEITRPAVVITSPRPLLRWNQSATFPVTGTARDNVQLAGVWYQVNGGSWNPALSANGWSNWTALANLTPGPNTVRAYAADTAGNISTTNSVTFTYVLSDRLELGITGLGTVTPNYSNAFLEIGKAYRMTARPATGFVFSNWTGTAAIRTPFLSFVMQSNAVFQANFVRNPFPAVAGTYQGLFYQDNAITPQSAGFIKATVTSKGTFSGKLQFAEAAYPFLGTFALDGTATIRVARTAKTPLTVNLVLDLAGNNILTGSISDDLFTASLTADRAVFSTANPSPFARKYTLVIPASDSVRGDGVATINLASSGVVTSAGALADGVSFSQSASVSRDGRWPMFASLYKGKGLFISWVQFDSTGSFTGNAVWVKPAAIDKFNPEGFTNQVAVSGNTYLPPALGTHVLNLTNATVTLQDGNLATPLVASATLSNNNLFTLSGTNGIKLTLLSASGLVNGTFIHPQTRLTTAIKGIVLQNSNSIQGFFLGTNQSGRFELKPSL